MRKQLDAFIKYTVLLALIFTSSCKKEHVDPDTPPGSSEPEVYISALLDNDSVYFAGGVLDYAGSTSVSDTFNYRIFNFDLKNSNHPDNSFFMISVNNYSYALGDQQEDLDSTIFPGARSYMFPGVAFIPLYVTVRWTDAAGVEFKSTSTTPNSFVISETEDIIYESKLYKKAVLQFDCYLRSFAGDIIHLTNGKATVVFSVN